MKKKLILIVVGTRPNFIKVTRFRELAEKYPEFKVKIVHTGQHYDKKMADVFFTQFGLSPDVFMNIGQGSPIGQMAAILTGLERICSEERPDIILVPGDVNSTFAAALAANKMNIRVAHIESGLRSFDRSMPEEFNRILTDIVADHYFITEQSGIDHLKAEGVEEERMSLVGNTMIDTLVKFTPQIDKSPVMNELGLKRRDFVLITMHRPATVDSRDGLQKLLDLIDTVAKKYKVVFPIHPRTLKMAASFGLEARMRANAKLLLIEPLDYFAFQNLVKNARFILTDSGGIQEESTFLRVPCLTLRPNTERPVTVELGTNELVPFDLSLISKKITEIEEGKFKEGTIPPLWDGKATERIFEVLCRILS